MGIDQIGKPFRIIMDMATMEIVSIAASDEYNSIFNSIVVS